MHTGAYTDTDTKKTKEDHKDGEYTYFLDCLCLTKQMTEKIKTESRTASTSPTTIPTTTDTGKPS